MLISLIKAPGQFGSEGGKESIFTQSNQVKTELFFSYRQLNILIYNLPARIQRTDE